MICVQIISNRVYGLVLGGGGGGNNENATVNVVEKIAIT